jgi:protein-tyrosine-phosphatase
MGCLSRERAPTVNVLNVLFVCDANCALSLMAESILASVGAPRFRAYSAGIACKGPANSDVLDLLAGHRMAVSSLRAKPLEEFRSAAAPRMDFIITLCDAPAHDLADWPGEPFIAHWNVRADGADGDESHRDQFWTLMRRMKTFTGRRVGEINKRTLERRALTLQPSYL